MSAVKKLAGQTAIYGLSHILGRFVNALLVPLLTRVFSQTEYGVNAEFYAYISFFNILLTHGMETAYFRFAGSDSPKVFSSALISVFGVSTVFLLLFGLAGSSIADFIGYGNHPEYIWFSVGILFFDSLSAIPFAYLRQTNRPFKFALVKNLYILINGLLTLYFLLLGPYAQRNWNLNIPFYHPEWGITNVFLANFIASLFTTLMLLKEISGIEAGFDKDIWRKMINYAMPMIWVGLAGMVNETLDRALLRYVWPDKVQAMAMNGIYAANYKLSIIITLFIQAYKYAAEPFFFSHAKTTDKRDLYAVVMNYFAWICMFIFLMVMFFLDFFRQFIGERFYEGLHVVPILLWANIFLGMYYNVSIWYKLSDNTSKGARISMIGAAITIVLNLVLIPKLGYTGCAWTTFICYLTMLVIGYIWGQKHYPIPYNIKRIAMYACISLLFYAIVVFAGASLAANVAMALKVILLLAFAGVAYIAERKSSKLFSLNHGSKGN